MPLPRSAWLSLAETVQFVIEETGESEGRVRVALTKAALAGTITPTGGRHASAHPNRERYFAHPVLYPREAVPPEAWGTTIAVGQSRVGLYDHVRFERAEIERWLGTAEPEPEALAGAGDAPAGTVVQPSRQDPLPPNDVAPFVARYVATEKDAGRRPTKKGLHDSWQKAGRRGHRDNLNSEFDWAMGDAAPSRGRPRKIAK
jgi:hypothetical protein